MRPLFIALIMLLGIAPTIGSCSHKTDEPLVEKEENPAPEPDSRPDSHPGSEAPSVLVAYFSCTNNTKGIADQIAGLTGAAIYRVEPETPYSAADLDYTNPSCRANLEQNDPASRPAMLGACENIGDYDIIFLGYPIWWGASPKIIYTFLESNELAGKTIVPFCTSHSSGLGSSDTDLHSLVPRADWKPGKRFSGKETEDDVRKWIESLSLPLSL